jgi:L-amino acid N-acyltransferase YncA
MSKGNMEIRKSTREDIKQIMAIFTTAKEYMAAHGNKTQWGDGSIHLCEFLRIGTE